MRSKLNGNPIYPKKEAILMFRLNPFGLLLETTPVLCQVGQKVDIKSTATTLTLMLTHPSPRFIAALQMSHEFFNLFHSDQTHHSRFSLENFYVIMYRMELQGFSSMHFSLVPQLNTAFLMFDGNSSSQEPKVMMRQLDLLPHEVEVEEHIDYRTFVSIDSRDFKRVVSELSADSVYVTLSDSQVKFSNENKEIIFTKEERQCIIGGVRKIEEFEFLITLHPLVFFLDLNHLAQRVWLFMQMDFSSILILPFGMWTQFWVYFSY